MISESFARPRARDGKAGVAAGVAVRRTLVARAKQPASVQAIKLYRFMGSLPSVCGYLAGGLAFVRPMYWRGLSATHVPHATQTLESAIPPREAP